MAPRTRGKKVDYREDKDTDANPGEKVFKKPRSSKRDGEKPSAAGPGKGRRKAGKLRDLMLMPIDIFAEICLYLHPKDLRSLSLASKSLRKVLLSKDSKHIWKKSIASILGTFECPPDLAEPELVQLLFGTTCYGCAKTCALYDFYHRVLYCGDCFPDYVLSESALTRYFRDKRMDLSFLPLQYLSTESNLRTSNWDGGSNGRYFYLPRVLAVWTRLERIRRIEGPGHDNEIVQELRVAHSMRESTGHFMKKFKSDEASKLSGARSRLRTRYLEIVMERLEALGWSREEFSSQKTEWWALIRKPKVFQEKDWDTLLPKLLAMLEDHRAERLAREKRAREEIEQMKLSRA